MVTRYGGEEFAMLLPQTPRCGAAHLAHRVLQAVEQLGIRHETSPTARHVSVSIGLGCYDEDSACWVAHSVESRFIADVTRQAADLVHSADKALYAAKRAGRAQAWQLDINDFDAGAMAREIPSPGCKARRRVVA